MLSFLTVYVANKDSCYTKAIMDGKHPNAPTQDDKARIQSTQAKNNDGKATPFSSRLQSSADENNPKK